MTSVRQPRTTPPSAVIPVEQRPLSSLFTLPDLTPCHVEEIISEDKREQRLVVSLGTSPVKKADGTHLRFPDTKDIQTQSLKAIAEFTPSSDNRVARVSLHGAINDDRADVLAVWDMRSLVGQISYTDLWSVLYGFWVRRDQHDRFPISIDSSFPKRNEVLQYFLQCGLGFRAPDASDDFQVLLDRGAFWQGAGAPNSRSWLRSRVPAAVPFDDLQSPSFPLQMAFTRKENPPVLTVHPLRPPKPAPGTIVYSRYIHSVGSHLQLTHIDHHNAEHFSKYCAWQNSDRVNVGWRERGPEEHHRKYLEKCLADPHSISYILSWDGEYAGYGEASWTKEDGAAAFIGASGGHSIIDDWTQGTHLLIGEEKFRGRHRFAQAMISMKHFCFLREPRTNTVIGEPRYDLNIISLLAAYLPQDYRKEVELPHKRSVLFILHRDRFFSDAMFY